jgi:hypothetical protein
MSDRFEQVVGLDLSLTSTGFACNRLGDPHAYVRTIKSTGHKDDPWTYRLRRLSTLADRILEDIPDRALVVLEAPSYGSQTGAQHDRSGLWWMVYDSLSTYGGRVVVPVAPTARAKYATGKGNAGKDAVLAAVVRRYPLIEVEGNDEADAVALMAIGNRLAGKPIDDPMPKLNLEPLGKLSIPMEV